MKRASMRILIVVVGLAATAVLSLAADLTGGNGLLLERVDETDPGLKSFDVFECFLGGDNYYCIFEGCLDGLCDSDVDTFYIHVDKECNVSVRLWDLWVNKPDHGLICIGGCYNAEGINRRCARSPNDVQFCQHLKPGVWRGCVCYHDSPAGFPAYYVLYIVGCGEANVDQTIIDIMPLSYPNVIHLGGDTCEVCEFLPVAILTTDLFNAMDVDPQSLSFGPTGGRATTPEGWFPEDLDLDGDVDMLGVFDETKLDFSEEDTEATLTGSTGERGYFKGTDRIKVIIREE